MLALVVVLIATALTAGRHSLRTLASSLGMHQTRIVHEGQPLPALSFTNIDGSAQTIGPSTLPARVTVLNIFTSWCPSCKEETPALAAAARTLHRNGIAVIGIDQDEPASAVALFSQEHGLTYPILIDTSRASTTVLGARIIPQTIVVKNGVVSHIAVGPLTEAQIVSLATKP